MSKPRLAFVPGDANGIGPELTAKVLSSPPIDADIILIGDEKVIAHGEYVSGKNIPRQTTTLADIKKPWPQNTVAFLPHDHAEVSITPGQISAACGKKSLAELSTAVLLTQQGIVDGVCFAPLNKEAMKAGGMEAADELHHLAALLDFDGALSEINVMDFGVWTSRVTSHVALRCVPALITGDKIKDAAKLLVNTLKTAAVAAPKIAIAALNPHGGDGGNFGREEIDIIAPAVQALCAEGYHVVGPYPADTLFRRTQKESINGVVTMYHDQGQIAMKLQGFERGVSVLGGLPVAVTTPAHGTAFDIAGQNKTFIGATEHALKILLRMAQHRRGEVNVLSDSGRDT